MPGRIELRAAARGLAAEDDEVEQRVRAQTVRAMDGDAGRLADRHQAGDDRVGVSRLRSHDFAVEVAGHAAHVVVDGGLHRNRLLGDIDPSEDARRLGDAGQPLVDHLGSEVLEMQVDVVVLGADAAALADLDRHGATHHIARGQVLGVRGIALHEALTLGVGEIAALAARALGDEAAGAVDPGRMELHELHVLQRQPGAQHHGIAVTGAGMRRCAGEVRAAVAAGRENGHVRAEAVQLPLGHVERDDAAAGAVLHDEIDREVLDEESRRAADRLLIESVQHRMAGAVRGGAGALRDALAELRGHAAEGPLVDAPFLRAGERHAVVLELDHRRGSLLAHELDRILVAQPVRALDGVVHVPAPVVLAHVAERGADAALRGHGVAARRKELGDAGGGKSRLRQTQRGAQAGAARADHDDIVGVIDELVCAHAAPPNATLRIASTPATATTT